MDLLIQVLGFNDTYIWLMDDNPSQKKRGNLRLTKDLNANSKIIWADQQKTVKRFKRDYISLVDPESEKPLTREKRLQLNTYEAASKAVNRQEENYNAAHRIFNDELWDQEWYLQGTKTEKALPKLDLNVLPLYRLGITGRGVRIAILDDGLEYNHDDLRSNYVRNICFEFSFYRIDDEPCSSKIWKNAHGTKCAGEIAMEANNRKCGVGIAFEASIGGIKLLDGLMNDRVEGEALSYKQELIDIYSASWGPSDDGETLDGPRRLAVEALKRGVTKGRNGKGNIYVWASGNGGNSDDCGYDGYVGSIYTVAVGSVSQTGKLPWYGERCPALLATTYSSGAYYDQKIVTTDLKNTCTTNHTGTSASAPLAAGILALALQVNNNLTWRDVQHLMAWSSEYSPLSQNPGWFKNAAGFLFNPAFGFGLMNGEALVMASYNWETVPEKTICVVNMYNTDDFKIAYGNTKHLLFDASNVCRTSESEIIFLEHVEIEVNLEYSRRGALEMYLRSPSGTLVQILSSRKWDKSKDGFRKWKFMSVATWGEDPRGIWILYIFDKIGPMQNYGTIGEFTLILHGSEQIPAYRKNGPRIYNKDYNHMHKTVSVIMFSILLYMDSLH
ncbi:Neuroendocrine convertase 1 [Camponotus floridanus]|uniref:Neuroendocrine convertase 1 n=1 Tax=Camponotus floridanus TaxID=104421 RepID=E2AV00_CAMFO|nr:Neuroendocrine convertase 1 [Camponotus floridanus]